jgi:hypothetical protein
MNVGHLLCGHIAIEPATIPTIYLFVPDSGGELRPISKMSGMKRDTPELSSEGSFRPLKMNLLVLVLQLVVPSEDIYSRPTPTRSNCLDKFANLKDRFGFS